MGNVIYYISQSFAGIGGGGKTDYEPGARDGIIGPVTAVNQTLIETDAQVTATTICGDNFMSTYRGEAIERVLTALKGREFNLFLAEPAPQADRYGVACGEIEEVVSAKFDVSIIASIHAENPGAGIFRKDIYIMMGSHSTASMKKDADAMVKLTDRPLKNQTPERPDAKGCYARGIRHQVRCEGDVAAAGHAADMLTVKATEQPYQSELATPKKDLVSIAPALKGLRHARIALANTGGIVSVDSPGRIQSASTTRWDRYDISKIDRLKSGEFKTVHAGFDPAATGADPNVIVPVDIMKGFLDKGKYGFLYGYFYPAVGTRTTQGEARRTAKEIIPPLKEDHADVAIIVSI